MRESGNYITMKKLISILIIAYCILPTANCPAQQFTSFSKNSDSFLKEMAALFQKSDNKKQGKILIEQFAELWNNNAFSGSQKKLIYTTSNALLTKKARVFPHFNLYITTLMAFAKSNQDIETYNNWDESLLYLLNTKKISLSKIEAFLKVSYGLFSDNTIFQSSTAKWVASSYDYTFEIVQAKREIKIVFASTDLVCYSKKDSANIYETHGTFYVLKKIWKGKNGKVYWQRAGFSKDKVFANLQDYKIDMKKANYKADSVVFHHTHYFQEPLLGSLNEKILASAVPEKASYPKFESYTKRLELKDIYPNIDYLGGFTMKGAKFIGSGSEKEDAYIYISRNDTLFLTAASKGYIFKKDRIIGKNTAVTLRLDTDSIYHPGLLFQYMVAKREVSLIRNGEGMSKCLYYNTYHGIDMDVELVSWKIDDPKIDFKMIKGSDLQQARFESSNFFHEARYNKLQGMDAVHPLVALKKFSKKNNTETFSAGDFANYMRISIAQIRRYLLPLSYMGIISYNTNTDEVVIKKRLHNYLSARAGRKDYDVIDFVSTTRAATGNASLNLLNFDLKVYGVPIIYLSGSQNVIIYPKNQKILLKRNMDFEFDGKIQAGLFTFYGKVFSFDYNNFKINLNNIDSLKIKVMGDKKDMYSKPILVHIKNTIENITGDLLIDNPENKSGVKNFSQFPIFNSKKNCYVFYDKSSIQNGVYKKDNFYFQIYSYSIDSLDEFSTEGLKFKGYFVSNIFPDFEEELTVQEDYSLGFIRSAPPGGFPVYEGKGTFHNDIKMSNKGLHADGKLQYVTSTTYSDDFVFFPDSMNTHSQKFAVGSQSGTNEFPSAETQDAYVHWLPKQDELYSNQKKTPFTMFDNQALLTGTVKVEPTGLSGWGKMDFKNAEMKSDLFTYGENTIDADISQFNMKTADLSSFTFKTDNVNTHIDFIKRNGRFKSNDETSCVEFPQNQYICYMDQFTWYMDKEEIDLSKDMLFISVHPKQDSLNFVAPTAKYDLQKYIITANNVPYIIVADAKVIPSPEEKVIIEKKAIMRTLKHSKIIANNTTKYHTIYNAIVNIYSKNDYVASGDYNYIDENNRKQNIHFSVVAVDKSLQTYATGEISESDNFTLSPVYSYRGKVRLNADEQYLTFTGATQISHQCDLVGKSWLYFSSEINPKQIYIPVSEKLIDIDKNELFASPLLTKDSAHIYSTFLSKRKKYSDISILSANGYLYYDKHSKKYKISSKDKLDEFYLPGNYLDLHKYSCILFGEGKINLGTDLGQLKLTSAGNITHNMKKNEIELDLVLAMDFYFAEQALEIMTTAINNDIYSEPVDIDRETYTKGLAELIGATQADEMTSEISLYGELKKIPKELEHTILLTDVKLEWNTETHSYRSVGQIGIGNILKTHIFRLVDGHIEIVKKKSGDHFYMYLQIDPANWFFFSYRNGLMIGASSDKNFNTIIIETSPDKSKLKVERGEKPYRFYIATERQKDLFLKRFEVEGEEEE